tara:strand:- start:280 stop:537 length:258 start_codon:yes stop_codon:yes gene_type:complete
METKHSTQFTVRECKIKLWASSIRVTDESGDIVEIDYQGSAFRVALGDYVVNSLTKKEQQSLLALVTNALKQREEREAALQAESK